MRSFKTQPRMSLAIAFHTHVVQKAEFRHALFKKQPRVSLAFVLACCPKCGIPSCFSKMQPRVNLAIVFHTHVAQKAEFPHAFSKTQPRVSLAISFSYTCCPKGRNSLMLSLKRSLG